MSEENKQNQKVADKDEKTKKSSSNRRRSNRRRKKPSANRGDEKQNQQNENKDAQRKKPAGDISSRKKDQDRKDQRSSAKKSSGSSRSGRRDHRSENRDSSTKARVTFAKPKKQREEQVRQLIYKKNGAAFFIKTGEKDVRLELMDQTEPHVLYRGNDRKYYVATEYSGIMHVIVKFETYEEAKEELKIRGEHDFSQILDFEVEGNIE